MNLTTSSKSRWAALPLATLLLTCGINAAPLAITNPSFEDDDIPNNSFQNGVAAGWTTVGNPTGTQDFNDGQSPQPTDGEQHGFASFQPASLSQVTTHAIAAGETYTLTVDVGQVTNFNGSEATIFLFGGTTGIGTPLSNTNGTAELAGIAPGSGAYLLDMTVSYTALASGDPFEGEQIGIGFLNSVGTQTLFDNVRLEDSALSLPMLDTLTSVTPADDATNVTISSNLEATFNKAITLTGSGTINLKNLSGGADIPIVLPGEVTILGTVLTIDPGSNLVGGEEYAVEISSDAIEDLEAVPNPYAGLLSTDIPNWSFTADGTAPTSSSMGPMADASSVQPTSDLTLTFGEDVQAGSGDITIHLASTDTVVETIDVTTGAVTIVGGVVTIDLSVLDTNTSYYVNIAAGAFEDLSGNPFAGITDKTTWAFTTGAALTNPSFEDDDVGNNAFIPSAIGWTSAGPLAGAQDFTDSQVPQPTDGEQHAFANGGSSLSQVTPDVITAGVTYTLKVDVGQLSNFSGSVAAIRLFGGTTGLATPLSNANGTAELTGLLPPSGGPYLLDQTVTYTALASGDPFEGEQLGIALIGESGTQVLFDNVRLEAPSAAAEPLVLKIAQSGGNLDFEWNSIAGMQYDLVSSIDPESEPDPSAWAPYNDGVKTYEDIANTGSTTMLNGVLKVGGTRFFALIEEAIPPLYTEGFEADNGGYTIAVPNAGTGTEWAHGMPNSPDQLGGAVLTGNGGSLQCWGTNLTGGYAAGTVAVLRSDIIDLTGVAAANLSFAWSIDADTGHSYVVDVIEDATDAFIASVIPATEDAAGGTSDWATVGPIALPGAALGRMIRLEWRFTGAGDGMFNGVYLDDVLLTSP